MTYSILPLLTFQLPDISFPFHNIKIKSLPLQLNHEYYSDLFENDFLALIPESFLLLSIFLVLLYGVVLSNRNFGNLASSEGLQRGSSFSGRVNKEKRLLSSGNQAQSFAQEKPFKNDIRGSLLPPKTTKTEQKSFVKISSLDQADYEAKLCEQNKANTFGGILGINTSWIAFLSIFFTIVLLSNNPISNASVLYSCFQIDDFALFLKTVLLLGSGFSIIISLKYLEQEKLNNFELQALILISSVSMLFLISSVDFISIYLAIECQSLCFYVMAGMKRESEFSTEAGLKYFVLGAFSSGILLFGLALQYGFTGTTNFSELSKIFLSIQDAWNQETLYSLSEAPTSWVTSSWSSAALRGSELGMIFVLVGFLFKVSAVPFHAWAPDVYEGAPTSVTAFFAIVPKISIFALFFRLCYGASYGFILSWQKILILSSILSMILGSLAALSQNKIKRLLAWSSIGHVGYLLSALCTGSIEGSQALFFYLVIYVVMTICLFQIVLSSLRREKITGSNPINQSFVTAPSGSDSISRKGLHSEALFLNKAMLTDRDESDNQQIKYTTDLAFLSQTNPVIAITIMITMFSIAGIPPLAGFFSKAFILFAAMSAKQFALAMIIITTSVISCFYYIRIVKIMYFEAPLSKWKTASKEKSQSSALTFICFPKESCIVLGLTFAIITFFCFNPTILFKASHIAALSLS